MFLKHPGRCTRDPCFLLEPRPALHIKIPGVNTVRWTGIAHCRDGIIHRASFLGADPRATCISIGLPYDVSSTLLVWSKRGPYGGTMTVTASFQASSRRARYHLVFLHDLRWDTKGVWKLVQLASASTWWLGFIRECP